MKINKFVKEIIYIVITILILFSIWAVVAHIVDSEFIFPSISETFASAGNIFKSEEFYISVLYTTLRSILAFIFSVFIAFILSLFSRIHESFKKVITLIVSVFRSIPTISVILLFIIWSPAGWTPIWVTVLIIAPIMYSSFEAGVDNIDNNLILTTRTISASKFKKLSYIYIPLVAPIGLESMASSISLGFKIVVASELLAYTSNAIGTLMQESRLYYNVAEVFVYTLVCVLISIILEYSIRIIKKKYFNY